MNKSKYLINKTFKLRALRYNLESGWMKDLELLNSLVPCPHGLGKMLDVCTGTGLVAKHGFSKSWEVTALDCSIDMLNQISDRSSISIIHGNAEALPFTEDTFDLVTCRQGLQYLNIPKALHEFYRVSRAEIRLAHIILEKSDDKHFWQKYFRIASPGRRHIFNPGEISKICREIGMTIKHEKIYYNRGTLLGAIKHLNPKLVQDVKYHFEQAPDWWKKKYNLQPISFGDFEYNHRWEIIIISKKHSQ